MKRKALAFLQRRFHSCLHLAHGCSHAHTAAKQVEQSMLWPCLHMETVIFPSEAALMSQQIMNSKVAGWS